MKLFLFLFNIYIGVDISDYIIVFEDFFENYLGVDIYDI